MTYAGGGINAITSAFLNASTRGAQSSSAASLGASLTRTCLRPVRFLRGGLAHECNGGVAVLVEAFSIPGQCRLKVCLLFPPCLA
jgi:hypothetical protein